jgi:hypothetical protein
MVKEEEVKVVDMEDKADIKKVLFYLYWEQEKGRMHFCEKPLK